MSVFLKEFHSFYITSNDKIVLKYKIGYETYINYIIGDVQTFKNTIILPKKNLNKLDTFPLEMHILKRVIKFLYGY